jgi:hypothetical protein
MAPLVRIVREPGRGPRNYVLGVRVHHGAIGAALVTVGARLPPPSAFPLVATGVALMVHDRRDFPWLADRDALQFGAPLFFARAQG